MKNRRKCTKKRILNKGFPLKTCFIEVHVRICFVALKVYKELERLLKLSEIRLSVDKVLALVQTIATI